MLDSETGLYYYGSRYYAPELGRFVQADTEVPDVYDPQQLNHYTYVDNNPFKYIDPTGHGAWNWIKKAVKGAILGDFAGEDLGVAGLVGQVAVGLSPAGILADVRDFAATGIGFVQGEASLKDLGSAALNLGPGVSETRKVAAVLGAAKEVGGQALRHGDEALQATGRALRSGDEGARGALSAARGGAKTPITSGAGRAGKTGTPNSIYEQLDDAGNLKSRTFYDENGRPFSRQDFNHPHGGMQPHEHHMGFDAQGRPIVRERVTPLDPTGYNTPTGGN